MATVLAAPLGATLCADQGADVVKLELPDGSDALRSLQPVKDGIPLWWKVANRGKRGISLDVRKSEGRLLLLKMLPFFDVLVENFRAGTLDKWGLDLATLHSVNPRLIVIRLTGFGQTGPYRTRPGYARIFEAMSGFTQLTGEAGRSPLHSNFPVGDAIAGLFCAFSIASEIARLRADPDARGVEVDLAATEALFRLLDPDCGSLPAPCIVPRVPGRDLPIPRTGPGIGEHNAQVYAEFGLGPGELADLRKAGVI